MALKFSVFEAKTRLSEILRLVKSGKMVIINQRGIPVAQIVPFKDQTEMTLRQRLDELRNQGLLAKRNPGISAFKAERRVESGLKRFLEDR